MKTQLQKNKWIFALAILGLLTFACGKKEQKTAIEAPAKVNAQVATAELTNYPVIHSFSGKLEAGKQSNLSTRIMGQVSKVHVKPGQKVAKGDLLITIRNNDILAKKAQVEASKVEATTAFESAAKDLKRFEALHASKSASDKELDDIRTHYNMSKARLAAVEQMQKEVEENIRYAAIRAPYAGVITQKFVQQGDMANPGMPLLGIESAAKWKVVARIPEADIAKINLNDSVKVQFNFSEKYFKGSVIEINPSTGAMGNQYMAKVLLETPADCKAKLYSGMFANVRFAHGQQKQIRVSKNALIRNGQLVGIYAVSQNGTALLRWVKTGKTFNDEVEILSGLSDREKYVVSPNGNIHDGVLIAAKN